jgi:hypothetical protein
MRPTKLKKDLGYHKAYDMYTNKSYLPEKLKTKKYFKKSVKKQEPSQIHQ